MQIPSATSAASPTNSPSVGCGWIVRPMSTASAPISTASTTSLMRSPACVPTMPPPRTRWLALSKMSLVKPSSRTNRDLGNGSRSAGRRLPPDARCLGTLCIAGRRRASDPEADLPAEIPASQAELALLCNASRKTFSSVVREFDSRRLVTLGYKSLTVSDPAGLRGVAEDGWE